MTERTKREHTPFPTRKREVEMARWMGMDTLVEGFFRGGAWGAAVGLFMAVVEVAPVLLR